VQASPEHRWIALDFEAAHPCFSLQLQVGFIGNADGLCALTCGQIQAISQVDHCSNDTRLRSPPGLSPLISADDIPLPEVRSVT